jgi:hypothetical protein
MENTVIRNPSEYARYCEELNYLKQMMRDNRIPAMSQFVDKGFKSGKQAMLNEMRRIGSIIGEDIPDYNSGEFSIWLRRQSL